MLSTGSSESLVLKILFQMDFAVDDEKKAISSVQFPVQYDD